MEFADEFRALRAEPPADTAALLRARHALELATERCALFAKERGAAAERATRRAEDVAALRKSRDEEIRRTMSAMSALRAREAELRGLEQRRREELSRELSALRAKLGEAPSEEQLAALESENERLQTIVQSKIDGFHKCEHRRATEEKRIEKAIGDLRASTIEKYEQVQRSIAERQTRQIEAELERAREREIRDSVARMAAQSRDYQSFVEEKRRQYGEYASNVLSLLNKLRTEIERKPILEERCNSVNKIFLAIFQENADLNAKLEIEKAKSEVLKEKCKVLQKMQK